MSQHPLHPVLQGITPYSPNNTSSVSAESRLVLWTLKRLSLERLKLNFLNNTGNENQLSFTEFNRIVYDFPVALAFAPAPKVEMHLDPKSIQPHWFTAFLSLPIVKQYENSYSFLTEQGAVTNKPIGLIFKRKGIPDGLIIHNGDWDRFAAVNSGCYLYRGKQQNLLVQTYRSFIDNIKVVHGWNHQE